MSIFRPELRPLAPGSLPYKKPKQAWSAILEYMPELPAWTRLPIRSFLECPTIQLCEGFPGVIFENDHIYIDEIWERDTLLDKLYIAYLGDNVEHGSIAPEYAACLGMLSGEDALHLPDTVKAVRGQILGPLSWGLEVLDQEGSPILYNEDLLDIVSKHLRLKAAWQEKLIRQHAPASLMIIEEPLFTAVGLASLPIEKERALLLIEDVLAGLSGPKGIHCSYPVDNAVLNCSANVLNLDVSNVLEPSGSSLEVLREFVRREGYIVWGLVPADDRIENVTVESLADRLKFWLETVAPDEEERKRLIANSMISAAGGLAGLAEDHSRHVLALTSELSKFVRVQSGLELENQK